MNDVNASAEDVRRLANALQSYKQEVSAASGKVRGALQRANCSDKRKTEFESRFADLQKHLDGFMTGEVDQMARALNAYAQKVDEISKMRM